MFGQPEAGPVRPSCRLLEGMDAGFCIDKVGRDTTSGFAEGDASLIRLDLCSLGQCTEA